MKSVAVLALVLDSLACSAPALRTFDGGSADANEIHDPIDAGSCAAGDALTVTGDYIAADGTEHWLRKSASASTYTIVPGGMADGKRPPQVFRVERVCAQWLQLKSTEGSFSRLDWATVNGGLRICVRDASSDDDAASLSLPRIEDEQTGCAGAPWLALTEQRP